MAQTGLSSYAHLRHNFQIVFQTKNQFTRLSCQIFWLVTVIIVTGHAYAQPSEVPTVPTIKIQYTHVQPNVDVLPTPGLPLTLTIQMNKEVLTVGMKVRGIITRDGVLTEVQDQEPRFDAMEKVYFDLEIPSPLAEVSYQFVFTDKSGNSVTTRRYQLTRKCIPNVTGGAIIPDGQEQVTKDDARQLKESADRLDEEIQLYEKVSQSLSLIQEAIDKK